LKPGKRNKSEIYPVFYLYEKTACVKIKYFTDTDTALLEFSDHNVAQTKEINENIYVDFGRRRQSCEYDYRTCQQAGQYSRGSLSTN